MPLQSSVRALKKPLRLDDEVRFLRSWIEKPLHMGAVMPSGRVLARTMAQEPSSSGNMPLGSGRTLEDLVKEMLRPMLKDWLDRNLPPMVEHMVRRELDRMTRKAEGV